jgi:hypothetical protein
LTAGTGISLDVTTGDITVTNSEPDQTVVLTDGTGITVTGTYPSFTIDSDITQYTDADARLAISAGTGITYDNTTGIVTNDDPDQTVVLTDGTGITVTGTYPSFTVTNSAPDQTVVLTNGTDITITGTYPSFTIAYSGAGGGSGTVTTASVVSANGFAGTVATDTTTPAITITTSITGILKGDGTAISAATSGTDYVVPSGSITGNAATVTTNADLTGVITSTGNATVIASQTGTGSKFVVDTSPTLVTPDIGAATATSLNKITVTAPATGATLTIADGATLTASATASVSGTNSGDSAINSLYSSLISDKTVVLTAGSGIGVTGTYPSFTITGTNGTVQSVSVVSVNGFAGTVATSTSTPAITISCAISGILKGNSGGMVVATPGTDYVTPSGSITGTASGLSATLSVASGGTGVVTSTGSGAGVHATSPALTTPTITGLIEVKTAPTISAGVLNLNCALGNVFAVSLNAAITSITFSNIPTGAYGLTLAFTCDGTARAVTWPASVKWSGGTAPTLTSTNAKVDIFVLNTWDGSGTTWYAMVGGQNF